MGECCYPEILRTLKVESISGDESLRYDFAGVFTDENGRYYIRQSVCAGRGNTGYSKNFEITEL